MSISSEMAKHITTVLKLSDAMRDLQAIKLPQLGSLSRDFPDAGAAFVQLQYLIDHGYAAFDSETGKIALSSADMIAGMTMLARELSQSVLAGKVTATMEFANRYCPHLNTAALDKMSAFLGQSTHTLDYVQPIYEHGELSAL
jgi:hypothetical protein